MRPPAPAPTCETPDVLFTPTVAGSPSPGCAGCAQAQRAVQSTTRVEIILRIFALSVSRRSPELCCIGRRCPPQLTCVVTHTGLSRRYNGPVKESILGLALATFSGFDANPRDQRAVAGNLAEKDVGRVLVHQRGALRGMRLDPGADRLQRDTVAVHEPALRQQPADRHIGVTVLPVISDLHHRAVGQPDPPRSLDLQEEGGDGIIDPKESKAVAVERPALDLVAA